MATAEQFDGPKTPKPDQLADVIKLANRIFRGDENPPEHEDMGRMYAPLFNPRNLEQLLIFRTDGRPVSLVGMTINEVVMLGCRTKIACIGSVCTDESAR